MNEHTPLLSQLEENRGGQVHSSVLNNSDDNYCMKITGYKYCRTRSILTWTAVGLSLGLLYLLFHWQPRWKLLATHVRCSLDLATKLLISETYQGKFKSYRIKNILTNNICDGSEPESSNQIGSINNDVCNVYPVKIYLDDGSSKVMTSYRYFKYKKLTYIWEEEKINFVRLVGMEKATSCVEFHSISGYSAEQQARIRTIYGQNEINVPVQTIFTLLVLEFFNPFYMFQVFTIGVWVAEDYFYYAIAIVLMSIFGITTSVIQTRRNQINLKSTVQSVNKVHVCRNRTEKLYEETCSSNLVPGDIILIPPHGCTMHVDAVLLEGSCIVNEGMLTGESVPVTKTALPLINRLYDIKEDSSHTLYCGTKVIQTRFYKDEYIRAVVLRTGFSTTKGDLVRSILYPLPADFKFDRDSYKFIIILTVVAFLGLLYTVILKSQRGITASDVVIKSLDILTIVVPPALPAAMTVGRLYAISRLKAAKIFCINPRVINVCGSTSCVCFDKTGTLTEDGLDMWGVIPVSNKRNCKQLHSENCDIDYNYISNLEEKKTSSVVFSDPVRDPSTLSNVNLLKIGMNVCHSLTILDDELTGDPLDVKMFQSTGWTLIEPEVPDNSKFDLLVPTVVKSSTGDDLITPIYEWGIVQQFQFNSSLQRSSVICKSIDIKNYMVFCKGSPEIIMSLSLSNTVPHDIKSTLKMYTQQGYRVLAMACRFLQDENYLRIQRLTRDQVETELIFLGLVILENRVKSESAPVITELHEANVKVVMITGDNLDTAISVGVECGILKQDEKLFLCEAVPSVNKEHPPEIYYTQSILNSQGLKQSDTPYIANITNKNSLSESFTNTASDTTLCHTSGSSSLSLESVENGLENKKFKFALTGTTWGILKTHYSELIPKIVTRGVIFARMSSDQKQQLVLELQALGYYVAMCGDGANDCGALKTAHVGISVSSEESSVASPFTSQENHIGCVPSVMREGRAALVTSFGMFKLMVAYSIAEFISVAFLYYFDSNLTDFQFMYVDLFLIVNFAFFFGKTHAHPGKLYKRPPETSLLGFACLFSILIHLTFVLCFQVAAYLILLRFDWYEPHAYAGDIAYLCYENYGVFCVSMFQYITLAVIFSRGKPYRKGIWTNWVYVVSLLFTFSVSVYITVYPAEWLIKLLELKVPEGFTYRYVLVILGIINFIICLLVEKVVVEFLMQERDMIPNVFKSKNILKSGSYQSVEDELVNSNGWPPLSKMSDSVCTVTKENTIYNDNNVPENVVTLST